MSKAAGGSVNSSVSYIDPRLRENHELFEPKQQQIFENIFNQMQQL